MTPHILRPEQPKAFFFRQTEGIENYLDYHAWSAEFDGLMGIMGKALSEERVDRNPRSTAFYSQFKKDHPEQLVLLHYNGNACDPRYDTGRFFAGHWLYLDGTTIAEDLPEEWNYSKVKVDDATMFSEYTGRLFDRKEDVAIVRLDEEGKPDWTYCEQAVIREIDYASNTLIIARAQYRTGAKAFKKGKARIAAHVVEGPWNGAHCNLMWFYNHSSECPRDEHGRNCADVLSELIAERFEAGNELCHYDGVELDVLFRYLFHHSYAYLQDWGADKKRRPDCNGDGIGDMGIVNGVDTYEKGVAEFVRKTREKLDRVRPGIIFMADGGYPVMRSFRYMNGVETEGYGTVEDGVLNWSDLVNTHGFWNANAFEPAFSYLNHRLHVQRWATHRVAFSSAMFTGSAVCQATSPPRKADGSFGVYDELVKGEENVLAWLGKPEGPAVHLVQNESDLLAGDLMPQIRMTSGKARMAEGKLCLEGDDDAIRFVIADVSLPTEEFTLMMRATCKPMAAYSPELARIVTVRPVDADGNSLLDDHEWWFKHKDRRWGYINENPYDNVFFFHKLPEKTVNIEVSIESAEPIVIESMQLFAAADVVYRVFENGMVITNPGLHPYTFDISELSPERSYRRLRGTERQDPEVNNGWPVGDTITLDWHDCLFLVRE